MNWIILPLLSGIGHDIQNRLLDRLEQEKLSAIAAAEKATWEEAEKKKNQAVRKVREDAETKLFKALAEQRKQHEQILKVIFFVIGIIIIIFPWLMP